MNCRIIELIIIIIGSILIPIGNWIIKTRKGKKEIDKNIYQEHFKMKYEQLFDEETYKNKNNARNVVLITQTENYNIPDIVAFCGITIDFLEKRNRFKLCRVNKKLKKLNKICDKITNLIPSHSIEFYIENLFENNSGYNRLYNKLYKEYKKEFNSFKKCFVDFYKSIFDTY